MSYSLCFVISSVNIFLLQLSRISTISLGIRNYFQNNSYESRISGKAPWMVYRPIERPLLTKDTSQRKADIDYYINDSGIRTWDSSVWVVQACISTLLRLQDRWVRHRPNLQVTETNERLTTQLCRKAKKFHKQA